MVVATQSKILQHHIRKQTNHAKHAGSPIGLHILQEIVFRHPARHKMLVTGRRFGKTVLQIFSGLRAVARGADFNPSSPTQVLLAEPTIAMAKRLIFKPLASLLAGHSMVRDINRSELTIDFERSKGGLFLPSISVIGLNDGDGDRARGMKIGHCGGDEYQDWKPRIFDDIIAPAMADVKGSTALLSGTPKGKVNHSYGRYNFALTDADWAAFKFKSADNPYLDHKELERLKRVLPPKVYAQEMEADFVNFDGQIFEFYNDDWIVSYLVPPKHVVMGIDWGDIHPAVTVCRRSPQGVYQLVSSWTNDNQNPVPNDKFKKICAEMALKWKVTHAFADPSRPAQIDEFKRTGGLGSLVAGYNPINEGLGVVNSIMSQGRFLFHEQCDLVAHSREELIEGIVNVPTIFDEFQGYHRKTHRMTNMILDEVAPNQFDHRCFAAGTMISTDRYTAVAIEDLKVGDLVLTRQGLKPITATMSTPDQEVVKWGLLQGSSIVSTPDHPVFTTGGLKAVKDLVFRDAILVINSSTSFLGYNTPQKEKTTVYNITVAETHEYYANGVLVSNCDSTRYAIATMEIKVLKHNMMPPKENVILLPNWVSSPIKPG